MKFLNSFVNSFCCSLMRSKPSSVCLFTCPHGLPPVQGKLPYSSTIIAVGCCFLNMPISRFSQSMHFCVVASSLMVTRITLHPFASLRGCPRLESAKQQTQPSIKYLCVRYAPLLQDFRNHSSCWGSGLRRAVSKLLPNADQPKGVLPLCGVCECLCKDVCHLEQGTYIYDVELLPLELLFQPFEAYVLSSWMMNSLI